MDSKIILSLTELAGVDGSECLVTFDEILISDISGRLIEDVGVLRRK